MSDRLENIYNALKELIKLGMAEFYTDKTGIERVRLTELGKKVLRDIKH